MKKIFYIFCLPAVIAVFSSCRGEDDFTESIFDTSVPVLDESKATYPFDKWLYDNFLVPYNVDVKYRFDFTASDMNFQLTPADYNRSQLLAYFIRYLFYDVYTKYAGDDFMKMYGPRIFHFIGSSGYSPTTGTEVLGTASGGVKITLYNVNEMKPYSEGVTYDGEDVNVLNERYFHTMHHEFSHILHQTKSYPITFGQVTSGSYDPINWQERDSVWTHQHGYVTHYASSATYEDFVETLSCIITDTDHRWMNRIISAASMGLREGEIEQVLELVDSLEINPDDPNGHWNNFTIYSEETYDDETGKYVDNYRWVLDEHRLLNEMVVNKEATAYVAKYRYTKLKSFTSFREYLQYVKHSFSAGNLVDEIAAQIGASASYGVNALLGKMNIATKWYTDNWGLYIFTLRHEVRERQDAINDYLKEVTIYELK